MKKILLVLMASAFFIACNTDANKSDNEKQKSEATEAADTSNAIDKAQEKMNDAIDTLQSKGGKLADTVKEKVVEPVKVDLKKAKEKLKEKVKEVEKKLD
jgi:seryl-tRNA synthetase